MLESREREAMRETAAPSRRQDKLLGSQWLNPSAPASSGFQDGRGRGGQDPHTQSVPLPMRDHVAWASPLTLVSSHLSSGDSARMVSEAAACVRGVSPSPSPRDASLPWDRGLSWHAAESQKGVSA